MAIYGIIQGIGDIQNGDVAVGVAEIALSAAGGAVAAGRIGGAVCRLVGRGAKTAAKVKPKPRVMADGSSSYAEMMANERRAAEAAKNAAARARTEYQRESAKAKNRRDAFLDWYNNQ